MKKPMRPFEGVVPTVSSPHACTHVEALIGNSPVAIVGLDARHRFLRANHAFVRLFGYSAEALALADFDHIIAAPGLEEESRHLSRLVLQGNKVHTVTKRRRSDGTLLDVEISGIPLLEKGRLTGVYALYQDLTERTRIDDALRSMADRVEEAQGLERRRIARDLHDSTSQELTALIWNLNRVHQLVPGENMLLLELVEEAQEIALQCSTRLRSAAYLMHPPELHDGGLMQAIPLLATGFEKRSGILVELAMEGGFGRFREEIELALFRIVQEGLTNVLRHSTSSRVDIALKESGGTLLLDVLDNGAMDTPLGCVSRHPDGVGLSGMRERVEQLGGTLKVCFEKLGTRISATIPVHSEHHA